MIEVEGLVKSYGNTHAVKGIDLHVDSGEIVAFLGPNGAGKTTTIEILEGFRKATSGTVRVMGEDPTSAPAHWRERLGIVLQESEPIPSLTALETVQMQSNFYSFEGRTRPEPTQLLNLVGLGDAADQRVKKLSGGQKRRLDLASALVGDPDLIFLDEPTTGFDPTARRESWKMVEALRDLNKTVLLTTHYMDEAEHLADRIVVINGGLITARGTAEELASVVDAKTTISWTCRTDDVALLTDAGIGRRPGSEISSSVQSDQTTTLCEMEAVEVIPTLRALIDAAENQSIDLVGLQVINPTLEDVYLKLVANPADQPDNDDRTKGADDGR